ncbi:MAG: CPBP family intramembrane metalloprotease, partial [Ilumatobacteraceae bacterium]|nr:CPBP family intramembrane metalloprotease [Ilumatobacteraceae bacterium]
DLTDLVGVPIGVLAQLVLVPVVYVPLRAVWPDTFSERALEETARDLIDRATGGSAVLLVLMVVVGAPIVEELVYRGLLQGSLARRINEPLALLVASGWFALIHFRPVEYPGLFVAGLVFGGCFLVTGRLGTAIVAHVAFNAAGLATAWAG